MKKHPPILADVFVFRIRAKLAWLRIRKQKPGRLEDGRMFFLNMEPPRIIEDNPWPSGRRQDVFSQHGASEDHREVILENPCLI